MKYIIAISITLLITGNRPIVAQVPSGVHGISLPLLSGSTISLDTLSTPLKAVVFLSPECPLCCNYTKVLNTFDSLYAHQVTIIGVFTGKGDSVADYQRFARKYEVRFKLATDTAKVLSAALHASVTPEVFLWNNLETVVYKGAIDNWALSLGKQRVRTTQHYLQNAIESYFAGREITPASTKAVGCYIHEQ
ncbi:redoxin domain-containing protein [Filimonas lacunae]|nr:redoxin domain-containing protein [Filimonas lacunae]